MKAMDLLFPLLAIAGIAVLARLVLLMNEVSASLKGIQAKVELTRGEVDKTLIQVQAVTATADKMMKEEVSPTIHALRTAVEDIHTTTHAVAETAVAARNVVVKIEEITKSGAASIGGLLGQFALKRGAGIMTSIGKVAIDMVKKRRAKTENEILHPEKSSVDVLQNETKPLPAAAKRGSKPSISAKQE